MTEKPFNRLILSSVLRLCIILFVAEWLIMQLMPLLELHSSNWLSVFIDASLLILFAAPIIYFWGLAPLRGERSATTWGLNPVAVSETGTESEKHHAFDLSLGVVVTIFGIFVFTLESGIMLLMQLFSIEENSTKSITDALLLSLLAIPIFYLLILRLKKRHLDPTHHRVLGIKQRFLIIFVPLFILLSSLSVVVYMVEFNDKRAQLSSQNRHRLEMAGSALDKIVEDGKTGVLSLSHRSSLQHYLTKSDPSSQSVVTQEFAEFLRIEKIFSQLCLLDTSGEKRFCLYSDIARYGQPINSDQQHAYQHYLEKTLRLNPDEIYIFPLQHKRRFTGQGGHPELGLRFASPLFDAQQKPIGILMLEYHSDLITQELQNQANEKIGSTLLLDERGGILFHSNPAKLRAGLPTTLAEENPGLWQIIAAGAEGTYDPGDAFASFTTLHPQPKLQYLNARINRLENHTDNGHVHADHAPSWKLLVYTPPVSEDPDMLKFGSNLMLLYFFLTPLLAGGSGVIAQTTYTRHAAEKARNEANISLTETVASLAEEIKAREQAEAGLLIANQVFQNTNQGIVVTSVDGTIQSVNPAFSEITGYTAEEAIGQNMRILKSGKHNKEYYQRMWGTLLTTGNWRSDVVNRRKTGELYPQLGNINAVYTDDKDISHFIYIFSDVTEIKKSEKHLEQLTNYDTLTGLPNRLLLLDRLNRARKLAQKNDTLIGVLYLDLYLFKRINDSFGFSTGDAVLKTISSRLAEGLDKRGTLARISDDEFVMITGELESNDDIEPVIKQVLQNIQRSILIGDHEIQMSANIGITLYPLDDSDADTLINNANTALNRAKQRGTNRYEYFDQEMGAASARHLAEENALRRAIENEELVLYYQPQVSIKTEEIIGVEALIRWPDIQSGRMTSPAEFIPLAEETGLIIPLGQWILRTACEQSISWQQAGYPAIRVGVNISPIQFQQSDIVQTVREVLEETGLEPALLDLELTEGIIMGDKESTIKILQELNDMGVKLSIDDFGTGYSSLSYLKRFPVHMLKIDQSFIRGITSDADDRAITETINQLGKNLGLTIIAEGVEDHDQLALLAEQECDMIQGFLFSRAVPGEEISILLKKQLRRQRQRSNG